MIEGIEGIYDELLDNADLAIYDQFKREEDQQIKEVGSWLWKAGYTGYIIHPYNGLIFITNKTKTRKEKLKWLKKYCEVLYIYGIKATVDDCDEPYICF